MPVLTRVGTFSKINVTGSQAVTGLGFTPKAIIFWCNSSVQVATWGPHALKMVGFTTGPTNSFSTSDNSSDATTATDSARRFTNKCISATHFVAGTTVWEADLTSMDADGFTINWTTNSTTFVDIPINYFAIGGSDIVGAKVVPWALPTAAGNISVAGVGFSPDLVFHSYGPEGAYPISHAHAHGGFGAMNKHGQQWSNGTLTLDAVNPSSAARAQQPDSCIVSTGATSIDAEGKFLSMDADGFTMNFSAANYARNVMSLCLKGVSSKVGVLFKNEGTVPYVQSISRLGFKPKGIFTSSVIHNAIQNTASGSHWHMGGSDGVIHRANVTSETSGVSPTQARNIRYDDSLFVTAYGSGTFRKGYPSSMVSDGFDITWTLSDTGPAEFAYVAIGDAGANTFPSGVGL